MFSLILMAAGQPQPERGICPFDGHCVAAALCPRISYALACEQAHEALVMQTPVGGMVVKNGLFTRVAAKRALDSMLYDGGVCLCMIKKQ